MKIEVRNLVKEYNGKVVVDKINMEILSGKVLGLLGPNGAGKSTTIKMISGQISPTRGDVVIDGTKYHSIPKHIRRTIGIMPQDIILWDDLTVEENLLFTAKIHRMSKSLTYERTRMLMNKLNLEDEKNTLAKNLSGGFKRRVNLAISIIHDPDVLFLDEPSPGIDPHNRIFLWDFIQSLAKSGKAIVLTDHYLDEAEKLSDYVIIIDHGTVIAEGTVKELKKAHGETHIVEIDTAIDSTELSQTLNAQFFKALQKLYPVCAKVDTTIHIQTNHAIESVSQVIDLAKTMQVQLNTIALKIPSLEDVFLNLTGRIPRD